MLLNVVIHHPFQVRPVLRAHRPLPHEVLPERQRFFQHSRVHASDQLVPRHKVHLQGENPK